MNWRYKRRALVLRIDDSALKKEPWRAQAPGNGVN